MRNMVGHVPEPEQQKKEASSPPQNLPLPSSSSEDDSDEDTDLAAVGYQPLTLSANDGVSAEFHAEQLMSDSSDDEMPETACQSDKASEDDVKREISVNTDLVLNAMKGISILGSNIPPWAKELSDNEWKNMIQRTLSGENAITNTTPQQSSTPPSSERTPST